MVQVDAEVLQFPWSVIGLPVQFAEFEEDGACEVQSVDVQVLQVLHLEQVLGAEVVHLRKSQVQDSHSAQHLWVEAGEEVGVDGIACVYVNFEVQRLRLFNCFSWLKSLRLELSV